MKQKKNIFVEDSSQKGSRSDTIPKKNPSSNFIMDVCFESSVSARGQ